MLHQETCSGGGAAIRQVSQCIVHNHGRLEIGSCLPRICRAEASLKRDRDQGMTFRVSGAVMKSQL